MIRILFASNKAGVGPKDPSTGCCALTWFVTMPGCDSQEDLASRRKGVIGGGSASDESVFPRQPREFAESPLGATNEKDRVAD